MLHLLQCHHIGYKYTIILSFDRQKERTFFPEKINKKTSFWVKGCLTDCKTG
jgi:hypothetical protein